MHMGADIARIVRLKCSVKTYEWGKVGKESGAARLYADNSGEEINADETYAEFWMGTHESGPSYAVVSVEVNGGRTEREVNGKRHGCCSLVSLKDWIEQNPSVLGDEVLQKWGPNLPFLFKVLSVAKALSIQAHPDKDLAAVLHKRHPEVYKDDSHKPEMALALTEFAALCGFVGHEEFKSVIQNVPEITGVVGTACANQVLDVNEEDEETLKESLQALFTKLMSASKDVISDIVVKLINRLNKKYEAGYLTDKEDLVLQLEKQYPGDVGVFAAFLLNYVKLHPGEALYLGANEPHAYLYGECLECMATSDNVVRAGLTPKSRDVQTLCSMLTYKQVEPTHGSLFDEDLHGSTFLRDLKDSQGFPEILAGIPANPYTVKYLPPFEEFEVDRCILPRGKSTIFPAVPGPSVYLVMAGEGVMRLLFSKELITEGDVLFTPSSTEIHVETTSGLSLYRAGINSNFIAK